MGIEPITTPEEIAADYRRWNPWWMWLLFGLWVFGTFVCTLWMLYPRFGWYERLGGWIGRGEGWIWKRTVGEMKEKDVQADMREMEDRK